MGTFAGNKEFAFFINLSIFAIGILAGGYILFLGQDIILPLIFGLLIAVLLNPVVGYLESKRFHRLVAITLSVFLTFLMLMGIIYFLASQMANLGDALPQLGIRFNEMVDSCIKWISETFHVRAKIINQWVTKFKSESIGDTALVIGKTLTTITGVLFYLLLIPVYMFLFLFYKPLILEFFAQLFPPSRYEIVTEVLFKTKKLIQNYLVGLCFEAILVAVLNSTALLILGIPYAILIGIIGALLNVIPYLGGIISTAIPMIMAMVTKEPVYALYVLIAYGIIQLVDNNFIVPKIVASKVKVNALVSIVVVLIGGALWGIPGMFVSLPLTAIVKVIFDSIDPLKPWGFLIGDTMPTIHGTLFNFIKKKRPRKPD